MNTGTILSPAVDTDFLKSISQLPSEPALQQAAPFLADLVQNPNFFQGEIRPLLEEARGAVRDWYVAHSYVGKDHNYSVQVFVWPPSTETKIHDHTSWGVYCCAVGSIFEERYERLDDGSRLDHARLKKVRQRKWGTDDGVSRVLPRDGGIHRVGNPGEDVAISVHLYGPRLGEVDGRDYDLTCDYFCDRREE